MEKYLGRSICKSAAIGTIHIIDDKDDNCPQYAITNYQKEIDRLSSAIDQSISMIDERLSDIDKSSVSILKAQQSILYDEEYIRYAKDMIKNQMINAEYAINLTKQYFAKILSDTKDSYMKERIADIEEVSNSLVSILKAQRSAAYDIKIGDIEDSKTIIASKKISIADMLSIDSHNIVGIVSYDMTYNSHVAIIARNMMIPTISQIDITYDMQGKEAIVDGDESILYIEPTSKIKDIIKNRLTDNIKKENASMKGYETITASGRKIHLYSNAGSIADIDRINENDGEGIGLLRTELLFANSSAYPSKEKQYEIYKDIATKMAGKKVIIRTFDMKEDKMPSYYDISRSDEILKDQIRAIINASRYGNISIMFPMIKDASDIERIKKYIVSFDRHAIEIGAMIETPEAVDNSLDIASKVDFLSIGTNDLIQYSLGLDRMKDDLSRLSDSDKDKILSMIKKTIDNAHQKGIWVGICGEMASDISYTKILVDMGIDELSVSPMSILPIRKIINEIL